jgi:hypothetical protein
MVLLTNTHDKNNCSNNKEYIDGVKVSALASTAVDRGCESQSGRSQHIKLISVVSPQITRQ